MLFSCVTIMWNKVKPMYVYLVKGKEIKAHMSLLNIHTVFMAVTALVIELMPHAVGIR